MPAELAGMVLYFSFRAALRGVAYGLFFFPLLLPDPSLLQQSYEQDTTIPYRKVPVNVLLLSVTG